MRKCDLCGNEAFVGKTSPYNPIKSLLFRNKYKVIWLCEKHSEMFLMD